MQLWQTVFKQPSARSNDILTITRQGSLHFVEPVNSHSDILNAPSSP